MPYDKREWTKTRRKVNDRKRAFEEERKDTEKTT